MTCQEHLSALNYQGTLRVTKVLQESTIAKLGYTHCNSPKEVTDDFYYLKTRFRHKVANKRGRSISENASSKMGRGEGKSQFVCTLVCLSPLFQDTCSTSLTLISPSCLFCTHKMVSSFNCGQRK